MDFKLVSATLLSFALTGEVIHIKALNSVSDHQDRLPIEGGAFFTAETKDAVKNHYKSVWAACLHAATLYLKQEGFGVKLNIDSVPVQGSSEMSEIDRFHLLLGMTCVLLCDSLWGTFCNLSYDNCDSLSDLFCDSFS